MKHKNKKPLYFISGEDFYFIAYSVLLVLELFGGAPKRIKDHRKIIYLIQFLSDERLVGILARTQDKQIANPADRELLFASFTDAELHKREVYKILLSLERKGYIAIQRTDLAEVLDVTLLSESLPQDFFKSAQFFKERKNSEDLKRLVPRMSTLGFDSLLNRLYKDRGVRVWAS